MYLHVLKCIYMYLNKLKIARRGQNVHIFCNTCTLERNLGTIAMDKKLLARYLDLT